jgi:Domain of unknown function (DUF4190)
MSYNYPGQYPGAPIPNYGPPRRNGLAIASLCCGIGQIVVGLLAGIPAVILGAIALSQIKARGEEGRGMAIAGITLGVVGIVLFIVLIVVLVAVSGKSG